MDKVKGRFRIITMGCKVNQGESESLASELEKNGWIAAENGAPVDICIVNTCTVTSRAAMQSRGVIRRAMRETPNAKMIVTGCYAQTEPAAIEGIGKIAGIVGNTDKHRIAGLIGELEKEAGSQCRVTSSDIMKQAQFNPMPISSFGYRTRPFLKIQDGCDAFCTYCIVPRARGRSRSLEPESVVRRIRELRERGYHEVVLTGIHIGAYGRDLRPPSNLFEILRRIHDEKIIDRVRISSIEPHELTDQILELAARSNIICPHFHIPIQSGDNGILEKMKRPYSDGLIRDLVNKIHEFMPDAAIGADVLVGFPGESKNAFSNTFQLIDALPFTYLHVFPYSPRKGTPASKFPKQVSGDVKKTRAFQIRTLGVRKKKDFYQRFVGKRLFVLVEKQRVGPEKRLKGISANYLPVYFSGDDALKNRIIPVTVLSSDQDGLYGEPVSRNS